MRLRYQRAHASKAFSRFGRSGDCSLPSPSASGYTVHMRTEKRRTYTPSCLGSEDYLSRLQPVSLCRCLLITTHLDAITTVGMALGSGTGEIFPRNQFEVALLSQQGAFGRGWRVPGCLAGVRWRKALSYSHGTPQAERSTLQSVAVKRVRASVSRLPFHGLQHDPPRNSLSLSHLAFASSQCEAAGHRVLRQLR